MLQVVDLSLRFGKRVLFEKVNLKFSAGNCYGVIGANGSGKSTFLKLLNGEIESSSGEVIVPKGDRIATLKQNHYEFDEERVIDTVIMGNAPLYKIMQEKNVLYNKADFNDADGMKLAELEAEFIELNGWEAESEAAVLLTNLGLELELHELKMKDLDSPKKVKVLLAQALFGNPDILLLDEPTNDLDVEAINWLENFLIDYPNTVIVVSHDRHFLNTICTHIVDIDFSKMKIYSGNYDFWYESSQLALKQVKESNKKKEEKMKELQDFIARFSANASKSRQATSRKKILEKISLEEIVPSSRKYPYIDFKIEKDSGKEILTVKNLNKTVDGKKVLSNVSFIIQKNDKVAFVGSNTVAKTMLFKILMGEEKADSGTVIWGKSVEKSYIPSDNSSYFSQNQSLIEWMGDYYDKDDETHLRSFLGRMLFSGDEVFKKVSALSGGEKARCMMSKAMLEVPNLLVLDEPTNHLDLETITSLNEALIRFKGEILFSSHDHQFTQTIANRIIEIKEQGINDRMISYDEYLKENKKNIN